MQNFGDILSQVFRAIWSSKLRSFLTMFGIAWGVGSMLLLIGVGEGFRSGQQRNLASFGNDVIMLWGGIIPAIPNQHTGMKPYRLTMGDVEAISAGAPEVRAITPELRRNDVKQVSQYATAGGQVIGTQANYTKIRTLDIADGRFLNEGDLISNSRVIVLGKKSAALLFVGHPALGQLVALNGTNFQVIGVAKESGHGNNENENQKVYIPVTTMLQMFPIIGENIPRDAVTSIDYQPRIAPEYLQAEQQVHAIVAQRHSFDPNSPDVFNEWDTIKSQKMVAKIFDAMNLFLGGVGVVTLALGAVGIINIMLVTVSERTREIGLRKALGATKHSILMQFFIEGLLLTAVSGLIGIGGSAVLMYLGNLFLGGAMPGFDPPRIVPWSAALALISLTVSGVVAGLYPASKAANLEPVEALRRE
ncbi:MAG TPA: ABC transporter permease [Acidisarcina sp.]